MTDPSHPIAPTGRLQPKPQFLPVLPLRDVVVFPYMVVPLFVGRARSIKALEKAAQTDKQILLLTQKESTQDNPAPQDLHTIGTVGSILQTLRMPDGTLKVLVEGQRRAVLSRFIEAESEEESLMALITELPESELPEREASALIRTLLAEFGKYIKLNNKIPQELMTSLSGMDNASRAADTVAAHLNLKDEEKQKILGLADIRARIEHILAAIETEMDLMQVEKRIRSRVKKQMEKSQREYYLNEQMKAIQRELGEGEDGGPNEADELGRKIKESGMPAEVMEKAKGELKKLRQMSPMSAEATVVRNYLDALLAWPWRKRSRLSYDLPKSESVLERDHYGLREVKDRILEHLAVQQRVRKANAAVLCLVGPPGVGKTSLGKSIAEAVNRKFIRVSLGGVRDEAEIRGHRRTYIGSMPGKIVQSMSKVKVKNPLFMLDEIDKMSTDFRGDPSSALLEVLDPEQNNAFSDHYLEVECDLSEVMFIATANTLNIPEPLLDRMEIIRLSGYTEEEKLEIAKRYLVPKQLKRNGLKPEELGVEDAALGRMIRAYTREAGVRNLEREIAKLFRKIGKRLLLENGGKKADLQNQTQSQAEAGSQPQPPAPNQVREPAPVQSHTSSQMQDQPLNINADDLETYLGVRRFRNNEVPEENQIGRVNGLAWTQFGGEILSIEASLVPGKGKHLFTGKLGDVMQESISTAITVVRSRALTWSLDPSFYQHNDVHVHLPEGATPKDGPSAGIGMCTAILSVLSGIAVKSSVAMTGEITLRGEVLAIGGLKEKLLAAQRAGIKQVIIPADNERDLAEIPDKLRELLDIRPVKWFDEVIDLSLERPLNDSTAESAASGEESTPKTGDDTPDSKPVAH